MKEWNPKMFANGVRVYEFFGYSYFLPLWGKNMLAFFANLPLEHRIRKELYEFTLETRIFEPLGINLSPERRKRYSHKTTLFQHCKNCIKRIIPNTIKFKHFTFDPINSRLYCEELIRNGNERGFSIAANGTNSIKVQWYLNMIKQRIANTKK
jgi:asparagine synthase (glutamine-hydrolysing)